MKSLPIPLLSLLLALLSPTLASAQKICEVTGRYVYTVSDNDDITLREAKRKCIELAKAEAIKSTFGEMVTSDVIDSRSTASGEEAKAYYWENTVAMARGDWVADTKAPALQLSCTDNVLVITAEVWGKAREIIQSKVDLKWDVLKD
ncbi:MAG: hypothetical protein IJ729_05345, partial [Alloprevotella sp.]|nr:hypothetical protein [Alloprevotella sp.]